MVSNVRPNASATPRNPIPIFGKAAASTALPQPPKTSQNVPMNSASALFFRDTKPPTYANYQRCPYLSRSTSSVSLLTLNRYDIFLLTLMATLRKRLRQIGCKLAPPSRGPPSLRRSLIEQVGELATISEIT